MGRMVVKPLGFAVGAEVTGIDLKKPIDDLTKHELLAAWHKHLVLIYPDLSLIVSGFHEGVNLISFSLAEVFVGHKQLRLPGQEALNAKHPQPPNHQLFKVALRA